MPKFKVGEFVTVTEKPADVYGLCSTSLPHHGKISRIELNYEPSYRDQWWREASPIWYRIDGWWYHEEALQGDPEQLDLPFAEKVRAT